MKKMMLILSVVFIIGITIVGCNQKEAQQNTNLEEAIYSVVNDKNITEIDLNSLTDFSWEKAFLFQPYSTQAHMNEKMGVNFKDPSNLDYRDDKYLLVFLYEGNVVQYAEIDRQGNDFNIEDEYLTKTNSKISINR